MLLFLERKKNDLKIGPSCTSIHQWVQIQFCYEKWLKIFVGGTAFCRKELTNCIENPFLTGPFRALFIKLAPKIKDVGDVSLQSIKKLLKTSQVFSSINFSSLFADLKLQNGSFLNSFHIHDVHQVILLYTFGHARSRTLWQVGLFTFFLESWCRYAEAIAYSRIHTGTRSIELRWWCISWSIHDGCFSLSKQNYYPKERVCPNNWALLLPSFTSSFSHFLINTIIHPWKRFSCGHSGICFSSQKYNYNCIPNTIHTVSKSHLKPS